MNHHDLPDFLWIHLVRFLVTIFPPFEKALSDFAEDAGIANTDLAKPERMGNVGPNFFHQARTLSFLAQMLKLSYLSTSFLKSFVFCRILNSAMVPIFNLNCEVGESEASGGAQNVRAQETTAILLPSFASPPRASPHP